MAAQLKTDLEAWFEDNEAGELEVGEVADNGVSISVGFNSFTINCNSDYPKKTQLSIFTDCSDLDDFMANMTAFLDQKKNAPSVADLCAKMVELLGEDDGFGDDDDGFGGDDDFGEIAVDEEFPTITEEEIQQLKKDKPKVDPLEVEKMKEKFQGQGSKTATDRLIKDLLNLKEVDLKTEGFSASLKGNDLYKWEARLFGFEGGMDTDLKNYSKKTGNPPEVVLEMMFPKDYPMEPPFIRVLRPRFAFHKGHVTIGGSICMELLTSSGWTSANDIVSILLQIRSNMVAGDARLDTDFHKGDYSFQEAKDAFWRVARFHGWEK